VLKQQDPIANVETALADLHSALVGDAGDPDRKQGPIANLESALADLHAALLADVANLDRPNADERPATTQQDSSGAEQAFATVEAETSEVQPWLNETNDRAARQREAGRFDQSLKDAVGATEQLRTALDNFIIAIAPLGAPGAASAAAAAEFRDMMRDSAAEALDLGAQYKRGILTSIAPQPAADADQAQEQSIPAL
jgi:hypothetical protein